MVAGLDLHTFADRLMPVASGLQKFENPCSGNYLVSEWVSIV